MKQSLFCLMLFAIAVVAIFTIATPTAVAQVPPGVVVDSIAPAVDWTCDWMPRAHHYQADPKTGKLAFVTGQVAYGGNPVWLSSTDNGATWSSLTGFVAGAAGRTAIAADSNFTIHLTYRAGLPSGKIGIYYHNDPNGDGTGLGLPVLVNDTLIAQTPNYPDIAVSPDGKDIIIMAIRWTQMDTLYAFVSHDSGVTWSTKVVASAFAPSIAPPGYVVPGFMWYCMSVAMGPNGYAFMVCAANYDSLGLGSQLWDVEATSRDYGETWSTPQWLPLPPAPLHPGSGFGEMGPMIVTDTIPHFAHRFLNATGQREMFELHKVNGTWTFNQFSHWDPATTSYDDPYFGSVGVDALGKLYCLYVDRNKSVFPDGRQVFIVGSTDGGTTWTQPVRLTDKEMVMTYGPVNTHWAHLTHLPAHIPDQATGIFMNGVGPGYYGAGYHDVTAWVQARFPLSVVWSGPYDKDANAPKSGGYAIASKGAPAYKWVEISDKGTAATGFYNPGTLVGDTTQRDDGSAGPFPVGFGFWFFNQTYSKFWVGANGLMSFTDSVLNTAAASADPWHTVGYYDAGYKFPAYGGSPFKTVVSPYYNDLDLSHYDGYGHGEVYYWTNAALDTCVVEWYRVGNFNSTTDTTLTFEVILAKADSSVTILFNDIGNTGTEISAKVAIQTADSIGLYYTLGGGYPPENTPANGTGVKFKCTLVTGVAPSSVTPETYALWQNYPNPFNPATTISYQLAQRVKVTLKVYSILGEEVATLVNEVQAAGPHTAKFYASRLASGVYFYRLNAGEFVAVRKMLVVK